MVSSHGFNCVATAVTTLFFTTMSYMTVPVDGNLLFKTLLPQTYVEGQAMRAKTNSLTSHTKLLPMPWQSMPWCQMDPATLKKHKAKRNLGEILWGNQIQPSLYTMSMKQDEKCLLLCSPVVMSEKMTKLLVQRIEDDYRGNLLLDGLPVAEEGSGILTNSPVVRGFPIGVSRKALLRAAKNNPKEAEALKAMALAENPTAPMEAALNGEPPVPKTKVYNHLHFTVRYHEPTAFLFNEDFDIDEPPSKKHQELIKAWQEGKLNQSSYRIVGFDVAPYSVAHDVSKSDAEICAGFDLSKAVLKPMYADAKKIAYTYSVRFEASDVEWSTRWDDYMRTTKKEASIHWMSIVNSFLMVMLLSAVIAIILISAVRKDLASYVSDMTEGGGPSSDLPLEERETGWKQLSGDVFRRPEDPHLLAIGVGSGSQMLCLSIGVIGLGLTGFASPQRRGMLVTAALFLYVCMGTVCGYVAARLAKLFQCRSWKLIFIAGSFLPATLFGLFFLLNFVHWGAHASSAAPLTAMLTIAVLFLFVSLPLVLVGAAIGYRQETIRMPTETKITQKPLPILPPYLDAWWGLILPSLLPFGASFIEAAFVLSSMWQGRVYHMFGFLAAAWAMVLVTTAEASVVMVYARLCKGDYKWWWTSYTVGSGYGVWLYLYGLFYYVTVLEITAFWPTILFFGYMIMVTFAASVITGTVGFIASFFFVRFIFGSIKVD